MRRLAVILFLSAAGTAGAVGQWTPVAKTAEVSRENGAAHWKVWTESLISLYGPRESLKSCGSDSAGGAGQGREHVLLEQARGFLVHAFPVVVRAGHHRHE